MAQDLRKEFVDKHTVMDLFGWENFASTYLQRLINSNNVGKEIKDFINSEYCQRVVKKEVFTEADLEFNNMNVEKYLERTIDLVMDEIAERIRRLPYKNMSEITYCGDCINSVYDKKNKCYYCTKWEHPCPPDHFCASGKNKRPII